MRHLSVLALAGAAALGACLLAAPAAQAATTSNCTSGLAGGQYGSVFPIVLLGTSSCPGFVDTGSPYVFHIATFDVLQSLPNSMVFKYSNVTATCGSVDYYNGNSTQLRGLNCTYANL